MKVARAVKVDDGVLTATNVAESEAVLDLTHTYAEGDRVRGTGPLRHTVYESLQATNLNHALDEAGSLWWIKVGPTNTFAMFDQKIGNQTTNAESIDTTLVVPGFMDTLAFLNVSASTVRAIVTSPSVGLVYDETFSMVAPSGVNDWRDWLLEPVARLDKLTLEDIPAYAGCTVETIIADPGQFAGCGELLAGFAKHIGDTQWGPQIALNDTSVKTRNDFGDVDLVVRPFYDSGTFTLNIDAGKVDEVKTFIDSIRGQFVLFLGDPGYTSTTIFGFVSAFVPGINFPTHSVASLTVESAS